MAQSEALVHPKGVEKLVGLGSNPSDPIFFLSILLNSFLNDSLYIIVMEVSALILVNGKFLLLRDGNNYAIPSAEVKEMEFPFDEFKAGIKKRTSIDIGVYGEMGMFSGKKLYMCKAKDVLENKGHLWVRKEDFLGFKYIDDSGLKNIVAKAML